MSVEPGLYRHWKGNLYRFLFLAQFAGDGLEPDADVMIIVNPEDDDVGRGGIHLVACRQGEVDHGWVIEVLAAKSSTDGPTKDGDVLVAYVALYGDGRVSVREISEWGAEVRPGVPRFKLLLLPEPPAAKRTCMACAYCGMGPGDDYPVCGHPDAGVIGTYIKKEPLAHCPNFSKFEQHPGRNPDGTLKRE